MSARDKNLAVIVLAAGKGTRMKSARPKVLHAVGGRALIGHIGAELAKLEPAKIVLVIGPGDDAVADAVRVAAPGVAVETVVQRERLGTGHAALQARAVCW
jgi:bifunctional UDP-N-acetylglucosamine pyrophosphorylase/glucosamine-1-phosphate N-acetyltransferase